MKKVSFNVYTLEKLTEDIEKAIKKYEELHFASADKVKETRITLPKIITQEGEEIDLEKRYPNAMTVMTQVGICIGIIYIQEKFEENQPKYFIHVLKEPSVILTTDDGKSLFIGETGNVIVDETGIVL